MSSDSEKPFQMPPKVCPLLRHVLYARLRLRSMTWETHLGGDGGGTGLHPPSTVRVQAMHPPSHSAHVSVCVPECVCEGQSCVCVSAAKVYESACVCCVWGVCECV